MRKLLFLLPTLFSTMFLMSCGLLDIYSNTSSTLNTDGISQNISSSEVESIIKVNSDATTVNISGVSGKVLTFVAVNTSSEAISTRNISGAYTTADERSVEDDGDVDDCDIIEENESSNLCVPVHYVDPCYEANLHETSSRAATSTYSIPSTSIEKTFSVGDKRTFHVLLDENLSDYTKTAECTLQAIETDSEGALVYVWVADSNFDDSLTSSKNNKINRKMAENLAKIFAEYKFAETNLVGEESEQMGYYYSTLTSEPEQLLPMEYLSETGTAVNIIVYDIANDWRKDKTSGTLGFFSRKDYKFWTDEMVSKYKQSGYESTANYYGSSNRGKYFYVDAGWCNFNTTMQMISFGGVNYDTLWISNNNKPSDAAVSTLFHEYQHMIHYGNKNLGKKNASGGDLLSSTWYNEMLSMLIEDVLQPIIGYDISEAPAKTRLPTFNGYYYQLGADAWDSQSSVKYYSSAYSFGAFLTRNYGGAKLIEELAANEAVDWDSILEAVETVYGEKFTKAELVRNWALASCFKPTEAAEKNLPTFYKKQEDYVKNGITYTLSPINLFSSDYANTLGSGFNAKKVYGPIITESEMRNLNSCGFAHMKIGTVPSNRSSVTLSLPGYWPSNSSSGLGEEIYILVHDSFNQYTEDTIGK